MAANIKIYVIILGLVLMKIQGFSQSNPVGLYENPSTLTYNVVELDPLTASFTSLVSIPGMTSVVIPDQSIITHHNNHYIFSGFAASTKTLYTVNLTNSTLISSLAFPQNIVGYQYNCNDSLIYGLYEFSNSYALVNINPSTGVLTTISTISASLNAYTGGTFVLDPIKNLYSFIAQSSSGLRMYAFDLSNGNLVHDFPWSANVVGQVYNGADSTIYGVLEAGSNYNMVSVDPSSGTYTTVGALSGVTPGFFTDATTISQNGTYIFRGFDATNNPAIITVNPSAAAVLSSISLNTNITALELPVCFLGTTVGLESGQVESEIVIYPNPAEDLLTIQTKDEKTKIKFLGAYDMIGNQIELKLEETSNFNQLSLNISKLHSGIFFLNLLVNNKTVVHKMAKY